MKIKKKKDINHRIMNDGEAKGIKFFPAITAKDGAPNFAMRLFDISPKGHTPKHAHNWEHEVYIISGNGFILKGENKIPVEKEDFILVPADELHQFMASDDGMSMICVVPNEGQPD